MLLKGAALFAACASIAVAYGDGWIKAGQFPQFRDLSGLPGAGFGVLSDGTPSINGAMAISTPIGFSLGNGIFDGGLCSRSIDNQPMFINLSTRSHLPSSGRAVAMAGVHTPIGNLTGSFEVLSAIFDQVYNAQLQLPLNWDKGGVSIGVQNFMNRGNAAAVGQPGEHNLSRSLFAVGTFEFAPHDYISLGEGNVRWRGTFGNISIEPLPRMKLTTEYDTFGFNSGAAYSFGGIRGLKNTEFTLWAGLIQEHRCTVAVNFAF